MGRVGEWMQTATGRQFWPVDPRAEEVCVEDVAHALANQCRFAGHCRDFYSVAEHSVRVSRLCHPKDALWGLLHDAAEAYLVDLPRPVKRASTIGSAYAEAETRVMVEVCARFGLPVEEPESVREADAALLLAEARDLLAPPPAPWRESQGSQSERLAALSATVGTIAPWSPAQAHFAFLDRFYDLTEGKRPSRAALFETMARTRPDHGLPCHVFYDPYCRGCQDRANG